MKQVLALVGFVLFGVIAFWIVSSEKSRIENEEKNLKELDSLGIAKVIQGKALESFSFYKHPLLTVNNEGVQIVGNGRPSGLFLRFSFDPTKTYKMILSGESKIGRTTLRLQYDNDPLVYAAAPYGSLAKIIQHKKDVEILLYSDEAFSYTLSSINIEECPLCKTNKDLKALILKNIPELETALKEDRKRAARLLLDWAANASDQAMTRSIERKFSPIIAEKTAAQAYYDVFLKDLGGVYCGGFSVFFDRILKMYDFNSFTINFGDLRDDLTHVTVLIGIKEEKKLNFYMYDPTFNFVFLLHSTDEILPIQDVFKLKNEGKIDLISVHEMFLTNRDYLATKDDSRKCEKLKYQKNSLLVCARPSFNLKKYFEIWESRYVKNGYTPGLNGFLQLFQNRVFSFGASLDSEATKIFRERLREWNIPYGMPSSNVLQNS